MQVDIKQMKYVHDNGIKFEAETSKKKISKYDNLIVLRFGNNLGTRIPGRNDQPLVF